MIILSGNQNENGGLFSWDKKENTTQKAFLSTNNNSSALNNIVDMTNLGNVMANKGSQYYFATELGIINQGSGHREVNSAANQGNNPASSTANNSTSQFRTSSPSAYVFENTVTSDTAHIADIKAEGIYNPDQVTLSFQPSFQGQHTWDGNFSFIPYAQKYTFINNKIGLSNKVSAVFVALNAKNGMTNTINDKGFVEKGGVSFYKAMGANDRALLDLKDPEGKDMIVPLSTLSFVNGGTPLKGSLTGLNQVSLDGGKKWASVAGSMGADTGHLLAQNLQEQGYILGKTSYIALNTDQAMALVSDAIAKAKNDNIGLGVLVAYSTGDIPTVGQVNKSREIMNNPNASSDKMENSITAPFSTDFLPGQRQETVEDNGTVASQNLLLNVGGNFSGSIEQDLRNLRINQRSNQVLDIALAYDENGNVRGRLGVTAGNHGVYA